MVKTIISVDVKKPAWEQDPQTPLHNRWHPDIPAVARVKEGELFRVECATRRPRLCAYVGSMAWRLTHSSRDAIGAIEDAALRTRRGTVRPP